MRPRRQRGQSIVEFALLMPVLALTIWGTVDFGRWEQVRVSASNGVRQAVRYAIVHPTAWSNAASAPANTIEGQLQTIAVGATVVNDDSHIVINYYDTAGGSAVLCGHYSASTNAFVAAGTYTQATCVIPNALINVSLTYTFRPSTPGITQLVPSATLTDSAQMVEEQ
ncbi:MAG TPA: TadE/TadG family type IV pilus assembly protein [Candidatus Dormibacteraeota bacterium]|jgi:Flp pilus assembly protein TadG|nr:TadE/TadG family type IV pilus assembly protein [Candidatus Dormibacteraeota bacterium]